MYRTPSTMLKILVAAAVASATLTANAVAPASTEALASSNVAAHTNRLIIKYRDVSVQSGGANSVDSVNGANRLARVAALNSQQLAHLTRSGQQFGHTMKLLHTTSTGAHVVQLSRHVSLAEATQLAQDLMMRDASVQYAEPDRMMQAMATATDPRYNEQWDFFDATGGLRLPAAWDKSTGAGINVAVIDTGFRPHADLAGQFLPGYDFISDTTISNDGNGRDNDASDPGDAVVAGECGGGQPASDTHSSWHGTHVAGTIAALTNNGIGVAGVAYNAKIVPARVLGKCGGYTSDIADAITWSSGGTVAGVPANANKARVINLSLGGGGSCDSTTQAAINGARSRGTVVVVAAGNSNADAVNSSPANCAGVITVAATNRSGGRAYYSNYGAIVDVAAPGGDARLAGGGILSTLNSGLTAPGADSYAFYQGTSMAAPHVAGVVALMLSANPALTPDEVEARLIATARPFPATCTGCGAGIVDAGAAVGAPVTTVTSTFNETESNNTLASANPVAISGTTVSGNMGSTSDNDYFAVQLPAGKTLTATLTMASPISDFDLYIYDGNGAYLGKSVNGVGVADVVSSTNSGAATVKRLVRVVYYEGGTGTGAGTYSLKLSW
jgi:serine protease